MNKKYTPALAIVAIVLSLINLLFPNWRDTIFAQTTTAVPPIISYQGRLTDSNGVPLTGSYDMNFCLYRGASGGSALWCENYSAGSGTAVYVASGLFQVLLGERTPIPDSTFDDPALYLGISVGSDAEMTPRRRVVSVGYAYRAEESATAVTADYAASAGNSDTVDGLHANAFAASDHTHSDLSGVPSGLIALFQNNCATGWTRVSQLDGKFLVGGSAYNAAAGGSNTHTHTAGSFSAPSHTHSLQDITRARGWDGGVNSSTIDDLRAVIAIDFQSLIAQSGGGGTISGTSASADSRPEFATIILCQKN